MNKKWYIDKVELYSTNQECIVVTRQLDAHPRLGSYYIHPKNWTVHYKYPMSDENILTDRIEHNQLIEQLNKYKSSHLEKIILLDQVISSILPSNFDLVDSIEDNNPETEKIYDMDDEWENNKIKKAMLKMSSENIARSLNKMDAEDGGKYDDNPTWTGDWVWTDDKVKEAINYVIHHRVTEFHFKGVDYHLKEFKLNDWFNSER